MQDNDLAGKCGNSLIVNLMPGETGQPARQRFSFPFAANVGNPLLKVCVDLPEK